VIELSSALAVAGTGLAAFAILAPRTVALLPAAAPAPLSRPRPPSYDEGWPPPFVALGPEPPATARWPAWVDPAATGADLQLRGVLIDALGAARTTWARSILERALDDEPDAALRAAIRDYVRS